MIEILLAACAPLFIYDGDNVRCNRVTYRLVGANAPEMRAACPSEKEKALRARDRLRQLAHEPGARLIEVLCHGSNFGRKCGVVKIGDQDVAVTLVEEGLADSYYCGSRGCPKRRNWCEERRDEHDQR